LSKFLHPTITQSSNSVPVTSILKPTSQTKPTQTTQTTQNALHNFPHHPRRLHRRLCRIKSDSFPPPSFQPTNPLTAPNPETDVASILEALREVNPEDAEAAAAAMNVKLRRRAPVGEDLSSILAALEANSPEDAKAAKALGKRQEDLTSILAALEANNPEDAQAARQGTF
jgi:hypothetical protein